jgi:hypothetical protein
MEWFRTQSTDRIRMMAEYLDAMQHGIDGLEHFVLKALAERADET